MKDLPWLEIFRRKDKAIGTEFFPNALVFTVNNFIPLPRVSNFYGKTKNGQFRGFLCVLKAVNL